MFPDDPQPHTITPAQAEGIARLIKAAQGALYELDALANPDIRPGLLTRDRANTLRAALAAVGALTDEDPR